MEENKIVTLRQPGEFADPLTEVSHNCAPSSSNADALQLF
jgi:hypothetical protein